MRNACPAPQYKTIDIWSPNQNHLRAQPQSFRDIRAASDARVKQDINLLAYSINDPREHAERTDGTIDLAATMVADNNALDADFNTFLRVCHCLDAFQHHRPLPVLLQELDVFPVVAGPWEDGASPFGDGGAHFGLDFDPVSFLEAATEDRIGQADSCADLIESEEGVIAGVVCQSAGVLELAGGGE